MAIRHFEYRFAFLSNRYPSRIELDGYTYECAENAYWGLFYPDAADEISKMPYYKAAMYGTHRFVEEFKANLNPALVPKDEYRVGLMRRVLKAKFSNPFLRQQLLNTGKRLLCNHTLEDSFWGECYDKHSHRYGRNNLGKLLMELREEYAKEEKEAAT